MKRLTHIFVWLVLSLILFGSCEEYYEPVIKITPEMLVVESRLTNNPNQNFVRLSMTRDFYSSDAIEWITGAHLELKEKYGNIIKGVEISPGYYTFPYTPIAGRTYTLWLSNKSTVYESDPIVMPPLPKIDSLYTKDKIEEKYQTNAYGVPELFYTPSREFYIDAPKLPRLDYFHFVCSATLLWEYYPPPANPMSPPPPLRYRWLTKHDQGMFNLAGKKEFSTSNKVRQHPILSLSYNGETYFQSSDHIPSKWIVVIDQYGIPKESFDYYEKLNKQFKAEGSLFDPVQTQVYGNIHCITDPSKVVLGFFDVCSHRQYRYYMNLGTGPDSQVTQRRLTKHIDISPENGDTTVRPNFWESY